MKITSLASGLVVTVILFCAIAIIGSLMMRMSATQTHTSIEMLRMHMQVQDYHRKLMEKSAERTGVSVKEVGGGGGQHRSDDDDDDDGEDRGRGRGHDGHGSGHDGGGQGHVRHHDDDDGDDDGGYDFVIGKKWKKKKDRRDDD